MNAGIPLNKSCGKWNLENILKPNVELADFVYLKLVLPNNERSINV